MPEQATAAHAAEARTVGFHPARFSGAGMVIQRAGDVRETPFEVVFHSVGSMRERGPGPMGFLACPACQEGLADVLGMRAIARDHPTPVIKPSTQSEGAHRMPTFSVFSAARTTAVGILAGLSMAAAQAQSNIDGSSVAAILEIAKGYGSADLDKDSQGDPRIRGRLNGRSYSVYFYGCKGGANCNSIQFHWGIDITGVPLSKINEWNKTKRFGKAYLDNKGELNLELDVNMRGGLSKANLDDTFDFWRTSVTSFYKEFVESGR